METCLPLEFFFLFFLVSTRPQQIFSVQTPSWLPRVATIRVCCRGHRHSWKGWQRWCLLTQAFNSMRDWGLCCEVPLESGYKDSEGDVTKCIGG